MSGKTISDKSKQLVRWVEHYVELYFTDNIVSQSVLDVIERLPKMPELDNPPTLQDVSRAIDKLQPWKSPGKDGIPAEVNKNGISSLL